MFYDNRSPIPGRVIQKTQKWYLIPPCLTLSIIRYGSRVKWSNPGKGIAPSPTRWRSSHRKGSLRVTLEYGRQLYLLFYAGFSYAFVVVLFFHYTQGYLLWYSSVPQCIVCELLWWTYLQMWLSCTLTECSTALVYVTLI